MQVKYQNANPNRGAQSYYIKFNNRQQIETNVVLVDSGEGVDVNQDLNENEYLAAILLTHAHADHYHSLHRNIEHGAEILTTPRTAEELRGTYEDAKKHSFEDIDTSRLRETLNSLNEIEDWEPVIGNEIKARPIPAGHSPGASGFILRFQDGDQEEYILVTGDFSFEHFAGNPGLPKQYPFEIGAMFLNTATSRENELEEALGTVLGHAEQKHEIVVTTSAANGIKFAYVLGKVLERVGETSTVKVIGSVAKLYDNLEYDIPNVASVSTYNDASNIIGPGTICITAPEKPIEGSSANFLRALDDETGVVVKFGNKEAVDTEKQSYSYAYSPHPKTDELIALVDGAVPENVIIEHGIHDRHKNEIRDAFVWVTPNTNEHTIYDRGWQSPRWMNYPEKVKEVVEAKNRTKADTLPEIDRVGSGLEEEGIDIASVFEARSDVKVQREESKDEKRAMLEQEVEQVLDTMKREVTEFGHFTQEATETIERAAAAVEVGQPIQAKVIDTGDEYLLKIDGDIELSHGDNIELTLL